MLSGAKACTSCRSRQELSNEYLLFSNFFFFARIGRSDLTRKLEKVGPFECDELEKHKKFAEKNANSTEKMKKTRKFNIQSRKNVDDFG